MADYTFNPTNGATTPVDQWTGSISGPTSKNKIVTIPTKDKYLDRNIVLTINKPSEATITTSFGNSGMGTYFNNGTSSDYNVYIQPKYTNTAGYKAATTTATNNGGTTYYKIKTSTITNSAGTPTATATAGTASVTTQPSASASLTRTGDIGTTTAPTSGTAGTDYWVFESSASANSGVVTATGGSASASVSAGSLTASVGWVETAVNASSTAANTGTKTGNTVTTTAATASDSSKVYLSAAKFTTLQGVTTTATDSNVSIVTTAGYSPLNYATGITVPSGTSSAYKNWSTTAGNYNNLFMYNTSTGVRTYFGYGGQTYGGTVYVGNWTSGTTNKTVGTISNLSLLGYSTSLSKCDTITTLNIGTSTTNKGGQISRINNYGRINTLYLNGGWLHNLYGNGTVVTTAGSTLTSYTLEPYSGTSVGGTLTTMILGAGTSSYRGGRINTLTMNAYSQIGTLTNGGTIGTLSGTGTISTVSGSQTITNVSGVLSVKNNALNGAIVVDAYDNQSTPALTGSKTVVNGGKWIQNDVNPSTSAQGPFYGRTTVGKISQENLTAANIKKDVVVKIKNDNGDIYSVTGTCASTPGDLGLSTWSPSSTYFQTSTTGAVSDAKYTKNQYNEFDYYIIAGSLSSGDGSIGVVGTGDSESSSNTSMSMATSTPTSGVYYTLKGSGSVSVGKAGWLAKNTSETSNDAYGYITKSVLGDAISNSGLPSGKTGTEIQPYGYIKVPAGYYPTDRYIYAAKANTAGETEAASGYSLEVSSVSGSSTVSAGTYDSTNSRYPITANNLSIKATLSASTPGWFSSGEATDSDTDGVTVGYMGAATCTVGGGGLSGGGLTVTTNYTGTPTVTLSNGSETNMSNIAIGAKNTTNYPYYFKVNGSSSSLSGKTKATRAAVTRAAITDAHTAGYLPAKTATTVIASDSTTIGSTYVEPTVTVNAGSGSTYIGLKQATGSIEMSSGDGSCAYKEANSVEIVDNENNSKSGCSVSFEGKGSVNATAKVTVGGYTPTNNSFATNSGESNTATGTVYIEGVTLSTPSSGTKEFKITVPNGSSTDFITFTVKVDSSSNVWVE